MANRVTYWLSADVARAAGIRRREVLGWIARGRITPCGVAGILRPQPLFTEGEALRAIAEPLRRGRPIGRTDDPLCPRQILGRFADA